MNGPMVDEDLNEGEDLNLGLRPESRVERRANRRKARTRRGFGCFAGLVSLLVVGGLIGGLAFGFGKGRDALEKMFSAPDYTGTGTTAVTVEIAQGQSSQSIADTLEKKGVVKSARAFETMSSLLPISGSTAALTGASCGWSRSTVRSRSATTSSS